MADDHRLLADACKCMLEPEFQVVGVESDGRSLMKLALALKPDFVILDIAMPHLNGLDAAQQIKQKLPFIKLVFLTMNQSPEVAADAFRRGASGYVLKRSAAEGIGQCDSDCTAGRVVFVSFGRARDGQLPAEPK